MPMIRGAATGISAIVDPFGRVLDELSLGPEGIIDGRLPAAIAAPPFARFSFWLPFVVWFSTLLIYMRFLLSIGD